MLSAIHRLESAGGPAEMRAALAQILGLPEPVPAEVLERSRSDDRYAGYLLRSRGHPDILEMLLRSPGNARYRDPEAAAAPAAERSNLALAAQAGAAALQWAAGGFKRLDPAVLERRLAACGACPHLREAPDRLIYRVALSRRSDPRVCGACGCTASRKASLPDEACPVEDSRQPGLTRWGEPIRTRS